MANTEITVQNTRSLKADVVYLTYCSVLRNYAKGERYPDETVFKLFGEASDLSRFRRIAAAINAAEPAPKIEPAPAQSITAEA